MADVGLGQTVTATYQHRRKVARDAMSDSRPVTKYMKMHGGYRNIPSGRSVVEEAMSDQNDTVNWVARSGSAPLTENNVIDAAEENMSYMLGSLVFSKAEQLENRGEDRIIPLVSTKMTVLEETAKNKFHEGVLSAGTGVGGLEMGGLAEKVSTTPTTGTVMGIDRSVADAAWFRNQKFDTSVDWSDGAVDSGNVKRFYDKLLNAVTSDGEIQAQIGLAGQTHWEALTSAVGAMQQITSDSDKAQVGHNKIVYRGVPIYFSGGINYSGFTSQTVTRSYILNVKPGGFNVVFMDGAEFDMLDPVNSADSAVVSRLLFAMVCTTIGAFAKHCIVGFD